MMTFSLVLVLVLGGQRHTFVMDTGLTAGDCVQALTDNPGASLRCEKE